MEILRLEVANGNAKKAVYRWEDGAKKSLKKDLLKLVKSFKLKDDYSFTIFKNGNESVFHGQLRELRAFVGIKETRGRPQGLSHDVKINVRLPTELALKAEEKGHISQVVREALAYYLDRN